MKTDFLVIGSGISGLNYALKTAQHGEVTIVTKKRVMESNTNYAQGGIAAAIGSLDSFEKHIRDTLTTGDGLCDRRVVELVIKEAPEKIRELTDLGVDFNREGDRLSLAREGGHSTRRIVFVGDYTGNAVEQALVSQIRSHPRIHIFEGCFAFELITEDGKCYGAHCIRTHKQELESFYAKTTILATGGIGQVYGRTSNPEIATGDGVAMAYNAYAKIEDIEFIQFHPTTFDKKGREPFLISETIRGEGATLRNSDGETFMKKYHEMGDLAPRDIVSRAIINEMDRGPVYLDLTTKNREYLEERFPTIYERLTEYGIAMDKEWIPVSPAAHYLCGGVKTDIDGKTNIRGLYAIGESACTGLHGANRLASNSLLGCLVFSSRAAKASARENRRRMEIPRKAPEYSVTENGEYEDELRSRLQSLMWRRVGVKRDGERLKEAVEEIQRIRKEAKSLTGNGLSERKIELRNMALVGELIARAALIRKESRGAHYREDYPERDDKNWRRHIQIRKEV